MSTEFKVALANVTALTGAIEMAAGIQNNKLVLRYELDLSNPAGSLIL